MIFLGLEIAPNHPSSLHYKLSYCQPELVMTMPTIIYWKTLINAATFIFQFSINRQCNFQTSGKERWTNIFPILFIHSLVPALSFILFIHPPSPFIGPPLHPVSRGKLSGSDESKFCGAIVQMHCNCCGRRLPTAFFASFPTSSIGLRRHICMI